MIQTTVKELALQLRVDELEREVRYLKCDKEIVDWKTPTILPTTLTIGKELVERASLRVTNENPNDNHVIGIYKGNDGLDFHGKYFIDPLCLTNEGYNANMLGFMHEKFISILAESIKERLFPRGD